MQLLYHSISSFSHFSGYLVYKEKKRKEWKNQKYNEKQTVVEYVKYLNSPLPSLSFPLMLGLQYNIS